MSSGKQPPRRPAGGLKALIEQSDAPQCETPNRPYLKAKDEETKTIYIIRPDCKLWACKACAERRRRLWVYYANFGGGALLSEGRKLSFVTLTSSRMVRTLAGGIWVWRRAWPKLSARWRRATDKLQYVYTSESGKSGHFHVHLITTATLPSKWYKDNAAETGLGYQAAAVPIVSPTECGGYLGKYLGKALAVAGWPKYWRRVNCSRGWPKPVDAGTPYEWSLLGSNPQKVIFMMEIDREEGWTVEHSLKELDWRRN